jgi:hypothetical protein
VAQSCMSCRSNDLSPIRRGFAPSFVNYKKGCTRLATASDKAYQLLAHGRWFSPASSTIKTGRHDIAEILLKVVLKHQKSKSLENGKIYHKSEDLFVASPLLRYPSMLLDSWCCSINHHFLSQVVVFHNSRCNEWLL